MTDRVIQLRADVDVGDPQAPRDTEPWAQYARLQLQGSVGSISSTPKSFARLFDAFREHRAWTLLRGKGGKPFASIDDFCATPKPWGLGTPWEEIRPYYEAVAGKQATQVMAVAPAQSPPGKAIGEKSAERTNLAGHSHERALRAIAERAPEPARELYKLGHIGTKEAAKLGPKSATPEVRARVEDIARKAVDVANANQGKPAREVQREVNRVVRAELGIRVSPVPAWARTLEKLNAETLRELRDAIDRILETKEKTA